MICIYFQLGVEHILDLNGYDHLLFLIVLCAVFTPSEWRKVLLLVTAFTIGHSITLILSGLGFISPSGHIIEFLIPATIFITAIYNLTFRSNSKRNVDRLQYAIVLVFGMIHGMGFSTYFKALLGKNGDILSALFAFNLGIEFGQVIIIMIIMMISYVMHKIFKVKQSNWNVFLSSIAAIIAVTLMLNNKFW